MPPRERTPQVVTRLRTGVGRELAAREKLLAEAARGHHLDRDALGAIDARIAERVAGLVDRDPLDASASAPLVLLPVRLETRFDTSGRRTVLRVRIFPDDVHVDQLDRGVDPAEAQAAQAWWAAVWASPDAVAPQAWDAVLSACGTRAGYVAHALTPVNLAERGTGVPVFPEVLPRLRRGPVARGLPDRFVAVAVQGDTVSTATGRPVPPDLPLGLVGTDDAEPVRTAAGIDVPPGAQWTVDYNAAQDVGMAVTVPLSGGDADIDHLVVLGVRSALDPEAAAAELEELLVSHRWTNGLDVVAPGTPTNNSDAARSPWRPQDPPSPPPVSVDARLPGAGSDGDVAARVLGISPETFGGLAHADRRDSALGGDANQALWDAGIGPFLGLLRKAGIDDAARERGRDLFVTHVRGRGPSPVLRVGRQPYGVLPVSSLARWVPRAGESAGDTLLQALRNAVRRWTSASAGVPVVRPGATHLDEAVLEAMGSSPVGLGLRIRPMVSEEVGWLAAVSIDGQESASSAQHHLSQVLVADLLGYSLVHVPWALSEDTRRLALPLVDPGDAAFVDALLAGRNRSASSVLQALCEVAWQEAGKAVDDVAPVELAARVATAATTLSPGVTAQVSALIGLAEGADEQQLLTTAAAVRAEVGDAGPMMLRDYQPFEVVATSLGEVALAAPSVEVSAELAGRVVGGWLRTQGRRAGVRRAMVALAAADIDQRQLAVAETLDLASHRVDAWVTGLVEERRSLLTAGGRGLVLGAFGVVENLRRGAGSRSQGGWLHAPSTGHATALGMLLSAHLGRPATGEAQGPFAIGLSSARAAGARALLDGVGQGQQLAALVGYRIERQLSERRGPDAGAARLVLSLRELAPLVAGRLTDRGGAHESVAAQDVVDGLDLLRRFPPSDATKAAELVARLSVPPANPYVDPTRWEPVTATERERLLEALRQAADDVDAVADVVLAESVLQHASGNPVRASATMDAVASGATTVNDPEVLSVRSTGERLTHRVLALVGEAEQGWGSTRARALAEPRLEAWCARRLGDPALVVLADDGGLTTLAGAGLAAFDVVLASTDPAGLEASVRSAAGLAEDVALATSPGDDWPDGSLTFRQLLALAVTARVVLTTSRALLPADLTGDEAADAAERDLAGAVPDLLARVQAANGSLGTAVAALAAELGPLDGQAAATDPGAAGDVDAAVRALDQFGLAVPGSASSTLEPARGVLAVARSRLAAGTAALSAATVGGATPATAAEELQRAARAVLGEDMLVLPLLGGAQDALSRATGGFAAPPASAVRRLVRDVATVRPAVGRLAESLLLGDALGRAVPLTVAQVTDRERAGGDVGGGDVGGGDVGDGGSAGQDVPGTDRWLAGPIAETDVWPSGPCAHLVLDAGEAPDLASALAGLVVDAWVEVLPDQRDPDGRAPGLVSTGVAVNAPSASARPPQSLLVAVSPDGKRWTTHALVDVVRETLGLARARMVTLERTQGDIRMLPALLTSSWSLQGEPVIDWFELAAVERPTLQYVKETP